MLTPPALMKASMAQLATLLVCIPKEIFSTREGKLAYQQVSWPSEYE
jgi:hypothetical protein